jgi:hypothetical protein
MQVVKMLLHMGREEEEQDKREQMILRLVPSGFIISIMVVLVEME